MSDQTTGFSQNQNAGARPQGGNYQGGGMRPGGSAESPASASRWPRIMGDQKYDPVETGREMVDRMTKEAETRRLNLFTTSQLRKILSSAVIVKNRMDREAGGSSTIPEVLVDEIQYMRLKLVYQMGREESLKSCLNGQFGPDLPAIIQNIGTSRDRFDRFFRLLESIVAYRKFAGRD